MSGSHYNIENMARSTRGTNAKLPNFFVGIPIHDDLILSNVRSVQEQMTNLEMARSWRGLKNTSVFKDAMIPSERLHVTLKVMHLGSDEAIQKAKGILKDSIAWIKREFPPNSIKISFEGVGTFGDNPNVVFAQVKEKTEAGNLTALHNKLKARFHAGLGIPMDSMPFHPHLTIAKIVGSKSLREKRIRSFPPFITSDLEDTHFGVESVHKIQLLRMGPGDPVTGRYVSYGDFTF